jgi:DNA-binding NarL/FixJ family response regulator
VSLATSLYYAVFRGAIKGKPAGEQSFLFRLDHSLSNTLPGFAAKVIREKRRRGRFAAAEAVGRLSVREREVAEKLCMGLKYEEIAQQLFVSLATIKKHAYNIYRKLDISNAPATHKPDARNRGFRNNDPSDKPQP